MSVDISSHFGPTRRRAVVTSMALALFALTSLGSVPAGASHALTSPDHGRLQINAHGFGPGAANDFALPCGFNVSFFGYDVGAERANIAVTPFAPTTGGVPISLRVKWQTSTRVSNNQLDQNVVVSPSLVANAFASSTLLSTGYHAMISVQVAGKVRSSLSFHSVWIASCAPASSVSTSSGTLAAGNTSGPSLAVALISGIVVGATQRVSGTSTPFTSGPVRLVTGEQIQFDINVVNVGNATLNVVLSDANCDSLTTSPSSPQTLSPGQVLTFFCSHVFYIAPVNHRIHSVASVSATTLQGVSVSPVTSTTTAFVFWPFA